MNRLVLIGFAIWAILGIAFYGTHLLKPTQPQVVRGPAPVKRKIVAKVDRRFKPSSEKKNKEEAPSRKGIYSNLQKKIAKIKEYEEEKEQSRDEASSRPAPATSKAFPTLNTNSKPQSRTDGYNPRGQRYEGVPAVLSKTSGELSSDRSRYVEMQNRAWTKDEVLVAFNQIYSFVMEKGGNYQSAFASLSRDVQISATPEPLKSELLQQIKQEEKGYRDYFQGQ